MTRRILSLGTLATVLVVAAATLPVSTQAGSTPALVITAYNGGPAIPSTTPKTPWGESAH